MYQSTPVTQQVDQQLCEGTVSAQRPCIKDGTSACVHPDGAVTAGGAESCWPGRLSTTAHADPEAQPLLCSPFSLMQKARSPFYSSHRETPRHQGQCQLSLEGLVLQHLPLRTTLYIFF